MFIRWCRGDSWRVLGEGIDIQQLRLLHFLQRRGADHIFTTDAFFRELQQWVDDGGIGPAPQLSAHVPPLVMQPSTAPSDVPVLLPSPGPQLLRLFGQPVASNFLPRLCGVKGNPFTYDVALVRQRVQLVSAEGAAEAAFSSLASLSVPADAAARAAAATVLSVASGTPTEQVRQAGRAGRRVG